MVVPQIGGIVQAPRMSEVFAITYGVELLCARRPTLSKTALLTSLSRYCPGVLPLDGKTDSSSFSFVHPAHTVELADASLPAQTFIAQADAPVAHSDFGAALEQAWDFPGARAAVAHVESTVLVTDLMTSTLDHRERLDLFQRALRGVLEQVPCAAIRWRPSNRIVSPAAWRTTFDAGNPAHLFGAGAVNVRLFNVGNGDARSGEMVMDTLGLAALGLPDLQCHFAGLEANEVARLLYNTAWYLFQEGDVIDDGHTVEGIAAGSRWRCQHEDALVGPGRVVLDLDPGRPYGAGNRG